MFPPAGGLQWEVTKRSYGLKALHAILRASVAATLLPAAAAAPAVVLGHATATAAASGGPPPAGAAFFARLCALPPWPQTGRLWRLAHG